MGETKLHCMGTEFLEKERKRDEQRALKAENRNTTWCTCMFKVRICQL